MILSLRWFKTSVKILNRSEVLKATGLNQCRKQSRNWFDPKQNTLCKSQIYHDEELLIEFYIFDFITYIFL